MFDAKRLQRARLVAGMSVKALAEKAQLAMDTVYRVEREPTLRHKRSKRLPMRWAFRWRA